MNILVPGARHLALTFGLLRGAGGSRDLTTDAQIAGLAIENNGTVFSHDSDFERFLGLRRIDPIT